MPRNLELVRRGFELFDREGALAVLAKFAAPDIEVHVGPNLEPSGSYRGREAAIRWAEEWFEAWEGLEMDPEELIEVGERIVVVPLREVARGRASGVAVEANLAFLFEIQDEKMIRFHLYSDKAQALAAAEQLASRV
jgi:ketosteroid isomerase-like protein